MNAWHLRDFAPQDLEDAVRLDERSSTTDEPPIFALADVVKALADRQPAVVAIADGHMSGGGRGWVVN